MTMDKSILIPICGFVCFLLGIYVAHITWRDKCIDNGAAYWDINAKTGKRTLRWFKYHHTLTFSWHASS